MVETSKLIKVISPTITILNIPSGKTVYIADKDIKKSVIKSTITRLNRKGYSFSASEAGVIGGMNVTRYK